MKNCAQTQQKSYEHRQRHWHGYCGIVTATFFFFIQSDNKNDDPKKQRERKKRNREFCKKKNCHIIVNTQLNANQGPQTPF